MAFSNGDHVMHWTFGFGKIIDLEKRLDSQKEVLHYVVQIDDMKIWVPEDEMLGQRLRSPSSEREFKKLQTILDNKKEILPKDRILRKNMITEMLKDGSAEALFLVVRGLANYRKSNSLNDYDQALMRRVEKALISEWGFALSVSPVQAETDLHRMLLKD
jgi:RNA polymerase-interacting CarD/CdnL/TRCF family regulator